jgi:hypothetical protein
MVAGHYLHDVREMSSMNNLKEPRVVTQPLIYGRQDDTDPTLAMQMRQSGLDLIGTGRYMTVEPDNIDYYQIVPASKAGALSTDEKPHWRIELAFEDAELPTMKLEVADAAVIGRGHTAHVRLDDYEGLGVSRNHAMLRPSRRSLYFFDLGSTNGSRHNGIETGQGAAVTLGIGDVIRLGRLVLTVRRIERIG